MSISNLRWLYMIIKEVCLLLVNIRFSKVKKRDSQPHSAQHQQKKQDTVLPQALLNAPTTRWSRQHAAVSDIHHGNGCHSASRRHGTDGC